MYFSASRDLNDLAQIKADMAKKNVQLSYDYLKFNAGGRLTEIEYHVSFNNVAGSDKTTDTQTEIGFIINTGEHPKYGIIVGKKESIQKRRKVLENKTD